MEVREQHLLPVQSLNLPPLPPASLGAAFGSALGDALGDALGEALGEALGDALGEAFGEGFGEGFEASLGTIFPPCQEQRWAKDAELEVLRLDPSDVWNPTSDIWRFRHL